MESIDRDEWQPVKKKVLHNLGHLVSYLKIRLGMSVDMPGTKVIMNRAAI